MRKSIFIILAFALMVLQCDALFAGTTSQNAPVAMDVYVKDPKAVPVTLALKAEGQSRLEKIIFEIISPPSQGTLKAVKPNSPTDPYYVYMPENGSTGEVTFTYIVINAYGESAPATVTIKVGTQKTSHGKTALLHKTSRLLVKQRHHHTYFVSTAGKSTGNGSMKKPWDLQTGLNNDSVGAGDTIVIENGTYKGSYICNLNGTQTNPITITSAPHGSVLIKSNSQAGMVGLDVVGTYTNYKNIVIDQNSPQSLVQSPNGNEFIKVIVRDSNITSGPLTIKDSVNTISTSHGINTTLLGDYSTAVQ